VTSPVTGYPSQWVGGGGFGTAAVTVLDTAATQNIALRAGVVALSGVVSANGVALANARVSAFSLTGEGVLGVDTDASGAYSLALPAGSYKLYVTSPVTGYPSQWVGGGGFGTAAVTVLDTATTQNIALAL
jgi:hypothetical protein